MITQTALLKETHFRSNFISCKLEQAEKEAT